MNRKHNPFSNVSVSLKSRNEFLEYPKLLQYFRKSILVMIVVILMWSFTLDNAIVTILSWGVCVTIFINHFFWIHRMKKYFQREFYYDFLLLEFIVANNLYSEKNGLESAILSYEERSEEIVIYGMKHGDRFATKLETLETEMSALLNLPLTEKIIREGIVEYHFQTVKPERLVIETSTEMEKYTNKIEINLGYGVVYNPSQCPHILVSGSTGSGKSVFISTLLIELLKRKSTVYICDPKNSDLGSLANENLLGAEKVATTPNNIARVVRLAVEEMKQRYNYMNMSENFKYGSNYSSHDMKEIWVIFDEMSAFQSTGTDKQSKAIVSEVMDGIKQLILLGRAAGCFILVAAQQMSANSTLSTDLRDNLGLRIALGSNSQEGYRMVFGSATPKAYPPIEVKGSGLLYMQGSGKESAQYYESPFVNMQDFDFITELKKYL